MPPEKPVIEVSSESISRDHQIMLTLQLPLLNLHPRPYSIIYESTVKVAVEVQRGKQQHHPQMREDEQSHQSLLQQPNEHRMPIMDLY
jgi:hypothetical protein